MCAVTVLCVPKSLDVTGNGDDKSLRDSILVMDQEVFLNCLDLYYKRPGSGDRQQKSRT